MAKSEAGSLFRKSLGEDLYETPAAGLFDTVTALAKAENDEALSHSTGAWALTTDLERNRFDDRLGHLAAYGAHKKAAHAIELHQPRRHEIRAAGLGRVSSWEDLAGEHHAQADLHMERYKHLGEQERHEAAQEAEHKEMESGRHTLGSQHGVDTKKSLPGPGDVPDKMTPSLATRLQSASERASQLSKLAASHGEDIDAHRQARDAHAHAVNAANLLSGYAVTSNPGAKELADNLSRVHKLMMFHHDGHVTRLLPSESQSKSGYKFQRSLDTPADELFCKSDAAQDFLIKARQQFNHPWEKHSDMPTELHAGWYALQGLRAEDKRGWSAPGHPKHEAYKAWLWMYNRNRPKQGNRMPTMTLPGHKNPNPTAAAATPAPKPVSRPVGRDMGLKRFVQARPGAKDRAVQWFQAGVNAGEGSGAPPARGSDRYITEPPRYINEPQKGLEDVKNKVRGAAIAEAAAHVEGVRNAQRLDTGASPTVLRSRNEHMQASVGRNYLTHEELHHVVSAVHATGSRKKWNTGTEHQFSNWKGHWEEQAESHPSGEASYKYPLEKMHPNLLNAIHGAVGASKNKQHMETYRVLDAAKEAQKAHPTVSDNQS